MVGPDLLTRVVEGDKLLRFWVYGLGSRELIPVTCATCEAEVLSLGLSPLYSRHNVIYLAHLPGQFFGRLTILTPMTCALSHQIV